MRASAAAKLSLLAATLLAGCRLGPDAPPKTDPPKPDAMVSTQGASVTSAAPVARWWEQLNDSTLNALMTRAETNNQSLAASLASVRAAYAALGATESQLWPQIGAGAQYDRTKTNIAQLAAAGVRLGEIFEDHGPARYRDLERQALEALLGARGGMVLATGGSVVTAPESWEFLRRGARTVWLQASPESHLGRVEAQGDFRPMRGREDALAELKGILAARAPLYAQAELHIDTEAMGPDAAAARIAGWLRGE